MPLHPTRSATLVAALAVLAGVAPHVANAQESITVSGVAYDSLRGAPLGGAVISVPGTGKTTVADRRGRFEIAGLAPGRHTFTMAHDAVDSLGLTGVSREIDVTDGRAEIRLAIPSFAAFWRAGCQRAAPRDSMLVYGAVRRADNQAPVPNARVEIAWIDLGVRNRRQVTQQAQTLTTQADANGSFGFCGVPRGAGLRIRASTDSAASGIIDLVPSEDRVRWRDLTLGPLLAVDSTSVGAVAGVVLRSGGLPFADARVIMDEVPEARTDSAGRFLLARVPAGTRQLQVLAVGLDAVTRVVDVAVGRTTEIVVNAERVTTLAPARVVGSPFIRRMAEGIIERQKVGFGTYLDSTDFAAHNTVRSVFEGVAGLAVRRLGRNFQLVLKESALNECAANLFIDGVRQPDQETLWTLFPEDVKAVEIYKRGSTVPQEFNVLRSTCGAVAVWTRRVFP